MAIEQEIELMRLRRKIADFTDFVTRKGLWAEFCDFRPSEERAEPKLDVVDRMLALFRTT